ncbi:MAG: hypothetical protein FD128_1435 [Hyphomonadaceae bacterium]|nr:MAG: hypothetical protein FD128_1435 [Hyphomonadaceae bacterium]
MFGSIKINNQTKNIRYVFVAFGICAFVAATSFNALATPARSKAKTKIAINPAHVYLANSVWRPSKHREKCQYCRSSHTSLCANRLQPDF